MALGQGDEASSDACKILSSRRTCLDHLANQLLEREVMQGSELEEVVKRELCSNPEPASGESTAPDKGK